MNSHNAVVRGICKKNRATPLWMIFAVGTLPVLIAAYMFFSGHFIPSGQKNSGELLIPPLTLADWRFEDQQGLPLSPGATGNRWLLLVLGGRHCTVRCQQALYNSRQVNIALGRDAHRVERYYAASEQADNELRELLKRDYPRVASVVVQIPDFVTDNLNAELAIEQNYIFIVDPLGNIIMYYTPDHQGMGMLDDIKWLLRLSNIG